MAAVSGERGVIRHPNGLRCLLRLRLLDVVTPPCFGGTNVVIPVNQLMGGSISWPSLSSALEILNIASTLEMFKNKDSSAK